jgi:hypothetical protein
VAPGEIRALSLEADDAKKHAEAAHAWKQRLFVWLNINRILIEVRTTARTELLVQAEAALPWNDRIRAARV